MHSRHFLFLILVAFCGVFPSAEAFPEKPIRVIVPTAPGGGHDTMARIFQRTIQEQKLLPEKLVVVNRPGAGGALGTREVKDAPKDGYTIGIWNPALVSQNLMGITNFDHTAFEIIGMTGYTDLGMAVKTDSPIASVESLVQLAKAKPGSMKLATEMGTSAHIIPLILAEKAGFEFRVVSSGGGSKRLASILGGHTEVALFSSLALINFKESGLRPLLLFAKERNPLMPDTPTALESGLDVTMTESRIWLAPKGTPEDRLSVIREALKTAMQDPATKKRFEALGIEPVFGDAQSVSSDLDYMRSLAEPIIAKIKR